MYVNQLLLRCFAKEVGNGQWVGICLDLNLAVQASSVDEIKSKLESMTKTYVRSALEEDKEYIEQLLNRKAPFVFFYLVLLQNKSVSYVKEYKN